MHPKKFTSVVDVTHKKWFCKQMHLDYTDMGIDFLYKSMIHGQLGIELKSKLQFRKNVGWMCSVTQMRDWEDRLGKENLFWMFMVYTLTKPISSIRGNVEAYIDKRECWVLPWAFMEASPVLEFQCGPHKWMSQKAMPSGLPSRTIGNCTMHIDKDSRIDELFDRREALNGW